MTKLSTALERFARKYVVDPDTGCWLWKVKGRTLQGYAIFNICQGREELAHRYSYEMHKGPIPEGYQIDQTCGIHHCVNPEHLFAVSQDVHWRLHQNVEDVIHWNAMPPRERLLKRFGIKYHHDVDGCWIWHGAKNQFGHGIFCGADGGKRGMAAHRWSYQEFKNDGKPLPTNRWVLRACGKSDCVNPDHLILVPSGEEYNSAWAKRTKAAAALTWLRESFESWSPLIDQMHSALISDSINYQLTKESALDTMEV